MHAKWTIELLLSDPMMNHDTAMNGMDIAAVQRSKLAAVAR